jgi:hypothetical protein
MYAYMYIRTCLKMQRIVAAFEVRVSMAYVGIYIYIYIFIYVCECVYAFRLQA